MRIVVQKKQHNGGSSTGTLRESVFEILNREPVRNWTAPEILRELQPEYDQKQARRVRNALSAMFRKGTIARPAPGCYRVHR